MPLNGARAARKERTSGMFEASEYMREAIWREDWEEEEEEEEEEAFIAAVT
jgi:hypothetical protein